MVIALVMMAWQQPVDLHEWSVVAEIGVEDGRLTGYSEPGNSYPATLRSYIKHARRAGVLSTEDAEKMVAIAQAINLDLEGEGLRVIGCHTMMDAVKAVFPKESRPWDVR